MTEFFNILMCLFVLCINSNANSNSDIHLPLKIDEYRSASVRWLSKTVLSNKLLDDMDNLDKWSKHGFAELSVTEEKSFSGSKALRLQSITIPERPDTRSGRPFGVAIARYEANGENWENFNRLSVYIYPHLPGFKVISFLIQLRNDGLIKLPDSSGRSGLNYILLKPDQWNHVVFEIAHLPRDKVASVDFIYRLQGHEPGATNLATFYLDKLELQSVEPDIFESWYPRDTEILYSHTGYQTGRIKQAITTGQTDRFFRVLRLSGPIDWFNFDDYNFSGKGRIVLIRKLQETTNQWFPYSGREPKAKSDSSLSINRPVFQVMDFTEIETPGVYVIEIGGKTTRPFRIQNDVWVGTLWKTLNFYFCERCGYAVPGIHDICHADWYAEHNGRRLIINGGWHDAGDLSQGVVNTAESAYSMLSLAETISKYFEKLNNTSDLKGTPYYRLIQQLIFEARWGVDWLLKTRFGDGFRVNWATMDYWTDNIPNTADDTKGEIGKNPFDNFLASAAESIASRLYKKLDPEFSEKCRLAAIQDWEFAVNSITKKNTETTSAGIIASIELWKSTKNSNYLEMAKQWANFVTEVQEKRCDLFDLPLAGWFYTDSSRNRILRYFHRAHDQTPIVALWLLSNELQQQTNGTNWINWYYTVLLNSEFYKMISEFTSPYYVLPASIYRADEFTDAKSIAQVKAGIPLGNNYYLRRFPVWHDFRGHYGVILSQAKALAVAAKLRNDFECERIAIHQLEWILGKNPFAQSTMYGEGWDFAPQYTAMSGDIAGSLPVGIQTYETNDIPYWPPANCYNYKEVWVHPSARWIFTLQDLFGPGTLIINNSARLPSELLIVNRLTHYETKIKRPSKKQSIQMELSPGYYDLILNNRPPISFTIHSFEVTELDPITMPVLSLNKRQIDDSALQIDINIHHNNEIKLSFLSANIRLETSDIIVPPNSSGLSNVSIKANIINTNSPWVVLIIPNNRIEHRKEIFGFPKKP